VRKSAVASAITEPVRDTETPLLFNNSTRVYYWGALAGTLRARKYDPELLYAAAMFHDLGLMPSHSSQHERLEMDGANAARDFLRSQGIAEVDVYTVWTAVAVHATPGIPQHTHPVVALLTAGVEMDELHLAYGDYSDAERGAVVPAYPRTPHFKEDFIQAFFDGMSHKPTLPSATSKPMCSATRTRISAAAISAK